MPIDVSLPAVHASVGAATFRRLPLALIAVTLVGLATWSASATAASITLRTVTVGAPGNPSVAIVPFTDAIYQSCADALVSEELPDGRRRQLSISDRSAGGDGPAMGDVPERRRSHRPRSAPALQRHESSSAWPRYGQINFRSSAAPGTTIRWHLRPGPTSPTASPTSCGRRGSTTRSTTGVCCPSARAAAGRSTTSPTAWRSRADRARHVQHGRQANGPTRSHGDRVCDPQPGRVDQGGVLRPHRRRDGFLLEVSDQPGRVRRRHGDGAEDDDAQSLQRRRHQRVDAAPGDVSRLRRTGAELVPDRRTTSAGLPERQSVRSGPDEL